VQWHLPPGKYAQVAMQRHYPFVRLQRQCSAHGNGLLPYTAKPLADAPLPKQYQHLFLYHPRQQQPPVYLYQPFIAELFPVEIHIEMFFFVKGKLRLIWRLGV
jgi:hypothetical protein